MLGEQQRDRIEKILRKEREDALEIIGRFDDDVQSLRERSGELSIYDQHPADFATEAMEKEKEFLLTSVEGRRLYEIDEALSRLYKEPETFGVCQECGRDISMERLEVVPTTTLCAEDAREKEGEVDAEPREAGRVPREEE